MKKLLGISLVVLAISPAFADDPAPAQTPTPAPVAGTPVHADPAVLAKDGSNNTINPGYALVNANDSTDGNAASAGYVKGAYNASIKAINTVADQKQNKLTVSDSSSGTGAVVTGVSLANDGTMTVTKADITIPVGSASASTRANIWVE